MIHVRAGLNNRILDKAPFFCKHVYGCNMTQQHNIITNMCVRGTVSTSVI
jgi:hypothetical protein